MGYKHYTEEYKQEVVDGFHSCSGISICEYAKQTSVNRRTLYHWLSSDGRPFKQEKLRISTKCYYDFDTKSYAIKQVLVYNVCVKTVALEVGVTYAMLYRWLKVYKQMGEYALMGRDDLKNKVDNEVIELKRENEKLKKENFEQRLLLDAYEVAQKILKNYQALSSKENLRELTNLTKARAIKELRAKYKLNILLELFNMKRKTYYDCCNAILRPNKYEECDKTIRDFLDNNPDIKGKKGYREVYNEMKTQELNPKERRIRYIMQKDNLLAYQTKSMKPYSSYKKDGNLPVKNWLRDEKTGKHFFKPESHWEILGTDVTEFHVNGFKVFFSPIIDFYDSMPVSWRISKHPDTDLIVGTVQDLIAFAHKEHFVLHMDQGSVNRSNVMKKICRDNHILQSMSRKGESGDNAPTEGFFGRLKQEWFNKTDFTDYTYDEFVKELERWIHWYCNKRSQKKLNGISPIQFRKNHDIMLGKCA